MCGISGVIDFNKKSSQSILGEMNDTMMHRGPDGSGLYFKDEDEFQIGLGHRRLAIIELSELGKQPKKFKQLIITFNGEIYNYKEINEELMNIGYSIESCSDTETILKAYHAWGEKCLDKFIGMFVFVIYNEQTNEIFIARDRTGIKPIFYYWNDSIFLFASELKAFHKHPQFKKEINSDALALYFQYGNVPSTHCIFKNCGKILPGHFVKTKMSKFEVHQQQYWNVYNYYNKPKLDVSFDEAKSETLKLLKSSSNYRMISDVPVGIFLSGGYDSACITAILKNENQHDIKTYTISVPDIGLNEGAHAKQTATFLATKHTETECSEKEAIEIISDLSFYFDEPFSDISAIPTILVSQLAKKEVTVALSADGGDELFAGYNRYSDYLSFLNKVNKYPINSLKLLSKSANVYPINKILDLKISNFKNRIEKLQEVFSNYSESNCYKLFHKQYSDKQIKNLVKNDFQLNGNLFESSELEEKYFTPINYAMAIDYQTYLVDDILTKVDRSTMSASIEGREPLLDHRLIEFTAQLPDSYKFLDGQKKIILKEIVHDMIPKELMDRPKMGFSIPISKWLKNELKENVDYYLSDEKIKNQEILNLNVIIQLKKDFYHKNKMELGARLWNILMFQMWYEKWFLN